MIFTHSIRGRAKKLEGLLKIAKRLKPLGKLGIPLIFLDDLIFPDDANAGEDKLLKEELDKHRCLGARKC